ncbi:probable N-acetyltransferase 16 isoform X2 [Anolis carolinensis]|uniref:probable N-acetyltransferase 16 isoform X2 n=1 Tax=Anolis carolinensis TaxID=28377 RepID=UPI002F2B6DC6
MIGLQSIYIIDSGETALVEGLRVAPWERGRGVAGVLQRFCAQMVKEQHPGVKVSRLTRDDQLGPKDLKKYRVIAKQGILLVRFEAQELLGRLEAAEAALAGSGSGSGSGGGGLASPPELLSESEVPAVVLSERFRREVLPGQTIIQDWQPFKACESNLALLRQKDLRWLVDRRDRPSVASLSTRPFAVPMADPADDDGSGGWLYLNVDAFGRGAAQLLQGQLLRHLRLQLPALGARRVACQLFLPPERWRDLAAFCRAALGLEPAKPYAEQLLLEEDLV